MQCGRVLLLDDSVDTVEALQDLLYLAGAVEVRAAASVREAEAVLRAGYLPCVILLDLVLHRERGEDLLQWLGEAPERGAVRVVAFSGHAHRLGAVEGSVARSLLKPAEPDGILAALAEAWASLVPGAGSAVHG